MNRFYVYEHWRPDKDICFYVGKGTGKRARKFGRKYNLHYRRIVDKLASLGMCVEVRMVASGLSENEAFALEIDRIAFWLRNGVGLSNKTIGGEGCSGLKKTPETCAKISAAKKGKKRSADTCAKMSASRLGWKHSTESRIKIGKSLLGKKRGKYKVVVGRSVETRAKISAAKTGMRRSPDTCEKMRAANIGKVASAETRARMSAAQKRRYRLAIAEPVRSTPP